MPRLATLVTAVCAATSALVLAAGPAAAEPDTGPGGLCADGNWFSIRYEAVHDGASGEADGTYVRAVPTTGGCASSWAHGDGRLSTSAIAAQCRTGIEARFGPYPITVRFAQTYVLRNRADCIELMSGVAHGEIDPGAAPLFPGGTR